MKMQLALLSLLIAISGTYSVADDSKKPEETTTPKTPDNGKDEDQNSAVLDKIKSIFGSKENPEDEQKKAGNDNDEENKGADSIKE